ncbi:shikimate dehydrogenase [Agromyces atrinae]|uniref:Shikimate dehydrogenase n=1 Tax=Agromyces atrinae TaxID=592376 RepID=A0A4Q2M2Q6_9MICO|nr:shikimate dehydrogenase [Agromyces atrinae]NYD65893.1 shikimate dehydrogenase [Agromyces atrinae]RXZ86234.1 shikimate dehydrogenase [Agromyces atrinae]
MSEPSGRRLAVLGSPIAHSKSPALHAAAYRVLGLDWSYERIEVDERGLADFLDSRDDSWRGFSLTMPLKVRLRELADESDRLATLSEAANTLVFDGAERRRVVFNTDVEGIVRALAESGVDRAERVVVLGGGATASSALLASAALGAVSVQIAVRTPAKATGLVKLGYDAGIPVDVVPFDAVADEADLVIATLPGGARLDADLPLSLVSRSTLFDVAYDPWPSSLAERWTDAGGRAISGLGMLLHQALVQVRIFVAGDPAVPLADEERVLQAMRDAIS